MSRRKWLTVAVLALVVALALVPVVTGPVRAAPPVPDNPFEFTSQFDRTGPNGVMGVWVWDPEGYFFPAPVAWHFVPARSVVHSPEVDAPPVWPPDVLEVQAVAVMRDNETPVGYWLWNPYRFVGGGDGPHFWSPTWEWYDAETA